MLKVLTDRGLQAGELSGALTLRQWEGIGAARLHGLYENANLMEYLSGPTLGEILQSNRFINSSPILAELAVKLRRPMSSEIEALGFKLLIDNYDAALSKADMPSLPTDYRETFKRAQHSGIR